MADVVDVIVSPRLIADIRELAEKAGVTPDEYASEQAGHPVRLWPSRG